MAPGRIPLAIVLVGVVAAGLGGSARAEPTAAFRGDSRPAAAVSDPTRPVAAAADSTRPAAAGRAQPVAAVPGWARPVPVARFGWPLAPAPSVTRPFQPPSMPYGPGHRGADLSGVPDQPVLAPADGTVVYAAPLADRGVVAVDHADGLRTSYEPVTAAVRAGQLVRRAAGWRPGTGPARRPPACTGACGGTASTWTRCCWCAYFGCACFPGPARHAESAGRAEPACRAARRSNRDAAR